MERREALALSALHNTAAAALANAAFQSQAISIELPKMKITLAEPQLRKKQNARTVDE